MSMPFMITKLRFGALVLGAIGIAVATVTNHTSTDGTVAISPSQQGTQVDTASPRDTFEYFLSGVGEEDFERLKENYLAFNDEQAGALKRDDELFLAYLNYKEALVSVNGFESGSGLVDGGVSLQGLALLNETLQSLQTEFFDEEQRELLFGEENRLRDLALIKLEIGQQSSSDEEFLQRWGDELDKLRPDVRESYRNASALRDLQRVKDLDEQALFLARDELVGTEAALRLTELDQTRANFASKVDSYMGKRRKIIADESLDTNGKKQAISELRNLSFDDGQQRRIEALERVDDDSGQG